MDWKPIETAPKDGTRVLLTDGNLFAAGYRAFRIESAAIPDVDRWNAECGAWRAGKTFEEALWGAPGIRMNEKPNPNAGKRNEWWQTLGCSAFDEQADTFDHDGPVYFEPTHWMPLPAPPTP